MKPLDKLPSIFVGIFYSICISVKQPSSSSYKQNNLTLFIRVLQYYFLLELAHLKHRSQLPKHKRRMAAIQLLLLATDKKKKLMVVLKRSRPRLQFNWFLGVCRVVFVASDVSIFIRQYICRAYSHVGCVIDSALQGRKEHKLICRFPPQAWLC